MIRLQQQTTQMLSRALTDRLEPSKTLNRTSSGWSKPKPERRITLICLLYLLRAEQRAGFQSALKPVPNRQRFCRRFFRKERLKVPCIWLEQSASGLKLLMLTLKSWPKKKTRVRLWLSNMTFLKTLATLRRELSSRQRKQVLGATKNELRWSSTLQ